MKRNTSAPCSPAAAGGRFPPSLWATQAMAGYATPAGWGQLALLLAVSLVLLAAMFVAANRLFYRGLLAGSGITARRAGLTPEDIGAARAGGAVSALTQREWRLLLRTPVFILQSLVSVLIFPLTILIWQLGGSKAFRVAQIARLPGTVLVLCGAGIVALLSVMSQLAPTTFSREGAQFWLAKVIPVPPVDQIRAKKRQIWAATILSLLPIYLILAYLSGFRLQIALPMAALSLFGIYPLLNLGPLVDLLRPKLVWTNPQQAMKGNYNVLLTLALSAIILTGCGALAWFGLRHHWGPVPLYGAEVVLLFLLGAGLGRALLTLAPKRFKEIEV